MVRVASNCSPSPPSHTVSAIPVETLVTGPGDTVTVSVVLPGDVTMAVGLFAVNVELDAPIIKAKAPTAVAATSATAPNRPPLSLVTLKVLCTAPSEK